MTRAAVFTGDLIDSTRAGPQATDLAIQALAKAARMLAGWTRQEVRFTRFRGDGWQLYLGEPIYALRATLLCLALLRSEGGGLESRISLAIAPVDRLGPSGLSDASGPAFTLSGRNLDQMSSHTSFAFAQPDARGLWKAAVLDLAVWQARLWTAPQAQAAALALDLPRQSDQSLADGLGITRQAFQARLKGSGLMSASAALAAFETEVADA